MDSDPLTTQRDAGLAVAAELGAAGFDDAEEIGRGGFGIVYRCTQVTLDRVVAVKVLTTEPDENRERFWREQRAMGRLTGHPNIVGVLQVGETKSSYPFLVMQYHRRGSLEARIRERGPLSLEEMLRLGVKMAGALASAHRLEILHRDIKPGNILFTDFGEPALSDFGIAHITGGFKTAAGTFTGSPAFTAPEILRGDPPSTVSDVYGLGATLFCAVTGHAAFERRSGEQLVAQFVRIAGESAPDLRDRGIPDDVAAVVERAMSRDVDERPSAMTLGDEIRRIQASHGVPVDEMALREEPGAERVERHAVLTPTGRRTLGNLPLELTSFIGRRSELSKVTSALSKSRLVTLTGIGGIGKTRLALRAAGEARADFTGGVWFADLSEVRDGSRPVDAVAAIFGLRDESGRSLQAMLVEFLSTRQLLLVLDNCEQAVDAVAKLAETLLRACPELRILATSIEHLGIGGELMLPLSPLACRDADAEPRQDALPDSDAVALFAERAAAAVPGFALTDDNRTTVARICSQLDGLPLAIELAAARLRVMSPAQILERLADRYALLTHGSRGAPTRQQTLRCSIGWSYDLCTAAEQQLWGQLSVFAGSFELEAAEGICADGLDPGDLVDLMSSLVEKSILIRAEFKGVVRFRFLETLREYGRTQIGKTHEYAQLRRRHADWYRQLVRDAAAEWVSAHQVSWIDRLERDLVNVREALEFMVPEDSGTALGMAAALSPFWVSRGLLGEGRRWLDRTLAAAPREPTAQRVEALYYATLLAGLQGDPPAGAARARELQALVEQVPDPMAHRLAHIADGFTALFGGDLSHACEILENAVGAGGDLRREVDTLLVLAWARELRGDLDEALAVNQKALALLESHGESVYRSYALWATGIAKWREGDRDEGAKLLERGLRLARELNDRRTAASCIEALAWIAGDADQPRRAVVMIAAAEALGQAVHSSVVVFPKLLEHEADCERHAHDALSAEEYDSARRRGSSMGFGEAVAYALAE